MKLSPITVEELEYRLQVCLEEPDLADVVPVLENVLATGTVEALAASRVAQEELELFPLDLIDWRMTNSHRWDLKENELVDRGGNRQAIRPIPTLEARIFRWNTNPYEFDAGANGKREVSGTYFLLPYWMGRYHKLFD